MLEEGAEMLGNLLLLAAMGLHARYVILDAEGLIRHKRKPADEPQVTRVLLVKEQPAEESEQEVEEPEPEPEPEPVVERPLKVRPPHGVSRTTRTRTRRRKVRREPVFVEEEEEEAEQQQPEPLPPAEEKPLIAPVQRKLTKAEKKALRRRLKKLAREREQQQRRAG
jgi:hypothetical protein